MTIQGAINELVNLLNADDIPVYYKGGIKKAIETIDDYIDGKDDYVKRRIDRKTEPQTETKTETQNSNLTFEKDECAKEYEELGLKELKELIEADRKTENSSEKPNNCDKYRCYKCWWWDYDHGCQTLYKCKYKPLDKDINVRSKDEPKTERSE